MGEAILKKENTIKREFGAKEGFFPFGVEMSLVDKSIEELLDYVELRAENFRGFFILDEHFKFKEGVAKLEYGFANLKTEPSLTIIEERDFMRKRLQKISNNILCVEVSFIVSTNNTTNLHNRTFDDTLAEKPSQSHLQRQTSNVPAESLNNETNFLNLQCQEKDTIENELKDDQSIASDSTEDRLVIDEGSRSVESCAETNMETDMDDLHIESMYCQLGSDMLSNVGHRDIVDDTDIRQISKKQKIQPASLEEINKQYSAAFQMNEKWKMLGFQPLDDNATNTNFQIWKQNSTHLPPINRKKGKCPSCEVLFLKGEEMYRHLIKYHAILFCLYDSTRLDMILPFIGDKKDFIITRVHEVTGILSNEIEQGLFQIHPLQILFNYVASGPKGSPFHASICHTMLTCPERKIVEKRAKEVPDHYKDTKFKQCKFHYRDTTS